VGYKKMTGSVRTRAQNNSGGKDEPGHSFFPHSLGALNIYRLMFDN